MIRVDVNSNATELTIAGTKHGAGHFRIYDGPPKPGIKLCGLWIDDERQYGVAVYQGGAWRFTVPDSKSFADWVYDQIDAEVS